MFLDRHDPDSGRKVRDFSLSTKFLEAYQNRQPEWGPLGYFTYKRTYARQKCECTEPCRHPTEEWWETIRRVVEGTYQVQKLHSRSLRNPWDEQKAQRSAQEMYDRIFNFKFLPPGRGLWVMGTDLVFAKGSAALNNCGFCSTAFIDTDFAEPFCFLMDMSMLGVGVGGDTKGAGKAKVHVPDTTDKPYVVEDSREGWVALIRTVLNSFVGRNAYPANIDYSQVRPKGTPIRGFGGTASGPEPLVDLVRSLTNLLTPADGQPYRITSTHIVDIFNYIGKCVVAGGVRRSAEIMFGAPDDKEFIELKQDQAALMDRRWVSNNSISGTVGMSYAEIAAAVTKNGEPGVIWLENMRNYSRMGRAPDYKDIRAAGCNPCVTGDTLIAVADGRVAVPIKVLTEQGLDVPLYSINPAGKVEIRMGRNPRVTQRNAKLLEIILDDGTSLRVTPNHKMRLLDGSTCEAKDLLAGDSLPRFNKFLDNTADRGKDATAGYLRVTTDTQDTNVRVAEHKLVAQFTYPDKWVELYEEGKSSGWHRGGVVVHHKDFNKLNNAPGNLEVMSFQDHVDLHAALGTGVAWNKGRPHSEETRRKIGLRTTERCQDSAYRKKLSESHTPEERATAAERWSKDKKEWWAAYYEEMASKTDLETLWVDGALFVRRGCEVCGNKFEVPWGRREHAYCTPECGIKASVSPKALKNRKAGQELVFTDRQKQTLHRQVGAYHQLQSTLGRDPLFKEWDLLCKEKQVHRRFRGRGDTTNPHALFGFDHLKEVAATYNHKVKEVRYLEATEDVYNITVDVNHTYAVVTKVTDQGECSGVFTQNCGEQTLENGELCCLVETFPSRHETLDDFQRTLKFAYLYAKTVTLIPTHHHKTNAVLNRNHRIGTSMAGVVSAMAKLGRRQFLRWCDAGYNYIQDLDKIYSDYFCVPRSIKTTSIKPGGTVPLLPGVDPGAHFPHAEYYIRNVRVQDTSPLVQACRDAGYKVEPDAYAPNTFVVSFPVHSPYFKKGKRDVTIWEQFAMAADMQEYWADNQVSITITFRPEEAKDIEACLQIYEARLKSVSLLPLNDSDHGYVQAPYIEITREEYEEMARNLRPIWMDTVRNEKQERFCDGDTCTI